MVEQRRRRRRVLRLLAGKAALVVLALSIALPPASLWAFDAWADSSEAPAATAEPEPSASAHEGGSPSTAKEGGSSHAEGNSASAKAKEAPAASDAGAKGKDAAAVGAVGSASPQEASQGADDEGGAEPSDTSGGQGGSSDQPSSGDPTDPSDPADPKPSGGSDDPNGQDGPDKPAGEESAPKFEAPEGKALPAATAGSAYWNTAQNKPLAKFQATGTPQPIYKLKELSVQQKREGKLSDAKRTVDSDGDAYWTGAGLPEGLKLNEETGEIEGSPKTGAQDGYQVTHEFTVVASNSAGEAERAFTLQVTDETLRPQEPKTAQVPDLVGLDQSTAVRRLVRAGFQVASVRRHSDRPAGEVISQDPKSGTTVEAGSRVELAVSDGIEEEAAPEISSLALYAYTTDARGSFVELMGDNGRERRGDGWWVPGSLNQKGQRIRLCAFASQTDGRSFSQNGDDWPSDVTLSWSTSDSQVAVVTSTGVVVATGDGTCSITATTEGGVKASLNVRVMGQAGSFPEQLEVIDEDGVPYGDERVSFAKLDSLDLQLYARVTFSDGTTASNCPQAADYKPGNATLKTLSWSTTNTEKGYINVETGLFVPRGYATLKAIGQVTGGDPDIGKGTVSGYVWIVIDSGEYAQSNPSNELKVKVVYETDESQVAFERSFSLAELRASENAQATYTITKDEGEYVTASARGIHLTTLLGMVRKSDGTDGQPATYGIDPDDLYGMRLAANDGVNPGLITTDFLFKPRYYFPNYEFGANTSGATVVFPMFAYESDWRDSARGARDSRADYSALDGGTRFRLMFGSVGTADGTSAKSLKYVNTVTFILKGAPPAQQGTSGSGGAGGAAGQSGSGDGEPGDAASSGDGDNADSSAATGNGDAADKADERGAEAAAAASDRSEDAESQQVEGDRSQDTAGDPDDSAFNVYQMISRAKTNFQYDDWTNPYMPWLVPLLTVVSGAGASGCFLRYRRQLA